MADQKLTQLAAEATPTDDDIMYLVDDPGGAGIGPTSKKLVLSTLFNPLPGTLTLANAGLHLLDTNATHDLIISPGTDLAQDCTLTIVTGDVAARSITLSGNPTLSDWFDQSVKQGASPTFEDVYLTDGGNIGIVGDELLTFNAAGTAVFSGCDVGIGGVPAGRLHLWDSTEATLYFDGTRIANGTIADIVVRNATDSVTSIKSLRDGANDAGAFTFSTQATGGAFLERVRITSGGNVGINRNAPQGRLHGYDAIGGFLYWEYDGVDGTARTVIPNAAGDVVYELGGHFVLRTSGGDTASGPFTGLEPGNSVNLWINGPDSLALAVAADGSVTVQRTGGALTYKVALWLLWI